MFPVMSKVGGIVLSDEQTKLLASCIDTKKGEKADICTAMSIVWGAAGCRRYAQLLANLNPKSDSFPLGFTHPLPNPNEDDQYNMIVPGARWKPQDVGGTESPDEIAQKEIRSWIIQETKGKIPEAELPWLSIPEELIIA